MLKLIASALLACSLTFAASSKIDFAHDRWSAQWIRVPGTDPGGYGVYHFRKHFEMTHPLPDSVRVFVSADNRYQLFLNGELISMGPARSDMFHWRYETVDLRNNLHLGPNVLAAVVWNEGPYRAIAQNSVQTGFILQAEDPQFRFLDTNRSWAGVEDHAYSPEKIPRDQLISYHAVGANEHFDAKQYPWGWQNPDFDDDAWVAAENVSPGSPRDAQDGPNSWMLVRSPIPEEKLEPLALHSVRIASGLQANDSFLDGGNAVTVPPNTRGTILFDQGFLTTAYPQLEVSGGAGSEIRLHYAEALYDSLKPRPVKGNRNDVEGKIFAGRFDEFLPDGATTRSYQPLFWRTYRYLQLEIQTKDEPLRIVDLVGFATGYPFENRAAFHVSDPATEKSLQRILQTGWRTARLCAHETYMDCPYYEQLQYAGDARIQMLVSLYNSGDSRLMRKGIDDLNASRTSEGATYSRAPSSLAQYIPPFSLWWIGMVHDYWMYVDDPEFARSMLPGVEAVLRFFGQYQKTNGSLKKLPWWNFVDWTAHWPDGVPPSEADGSSAAAIDLQLLLAYDWAADLEHALGDEPLSLKYRRAAEQLRETVWRTDWDETRKLFADQPAHTTYSQQTNTLAVLAGVVPQETAREVVQTVISDSTLEQSSIYFSAYTNEALAKAGLGDVYLSRLAPWRHMLDQGLSTWAEIDSPETRSDCHAWGASPNIEVYRTIAGITPAAPGFRSVRIQPNLGELEDVRATVPHPAGQIYVDITRRHAHVELPTGIPGVFIWSGKTYKLNPGTNDFRLP